MRPMLNPALRQLRRDDSTIQIGIDPVRALVLGGLGPAAVSALDLIDGTRSYDQILDDACLTGLPRAHGARLLSILDTAGALIPAASLAPSWCDPFDAERLGRERRALALRAVGAGGAAQRLARRRDRRVTIVGADLISGQVASVLGAAGVGSLRIDDPVLVSPDDLSPGGFTAEDVGHPREAAVRSRLHRSLPWVSVEHADAPADFVVLSDPPAAADPDRHAVRRPHLALGVRDAAGVVGPLVIPGRTACLRCLQLTRADRDPGWSRIAAQLAAPRRSSPVCELTLATRIAGLAAQQALAFLDGEPAVPACDATLEVDPHDYRVRRRSWQPHPACGCGAG
jgi:bacteriocin biosynthesis cyclodehydratase domain-containing protein